MSFGLRDVLSNDLNASKIWFIWRELDSNAVSDQSIPASGFAPKRMKSLTVSAPNLVTISPGLTVLPRDFPILTDRVVRPAPQLGQSPPKFSIWYSELHSTQKGAGAFNMP